MTFSELMQLLSVIGYDAALLGGVFLLLWNMFVLYDDGITLVYFQKSADVGWLALLMIPVEMCVLTIYIIVVGPYIIL